MASEATTDGFIVVSMMKNEAMICKDWVNHYLAEGANHLFVIDHNSDDGMGDVLRKAGKYQITVVRDESPWCRGIQNVLLNKHFKDVVKRHCGWCFVCDADEYAFALDENKTLADALASIPSNTCRIFLPWYLFGSSGHVSHPAGSIVDNFTMRCDKVEQGTHLGHGKTLFRSELLRHLETHASVLENAKGRNNNALMPDDAASSLFRLNHYVTLSEEYFKRVKSVRGGGQSGKTQTYTLNHFHKVQHLYSRVEDTLLRDKRAKSKLKVLNTAQSSTEM